MISSIITYTKTDESPALATYSFLPIMQAFAKSVGIDIVTKDISLAARILANFPENLTTEQKVEDALLALGKLVKTPEANIIKLPNISASIPQLKAAIEELQSQGFDIPNYPSDAQTDDEKDVKARYGKVLGSAVNPVLREGNSDRRVAAPVKQYAKDNPHTMGEWSADSKTHVASMDDGDFYSSEQSVVLPVADSVSIQFRSSEGELTTLKASIPLLEGEIIDSSCINIKALRDYYEASMQDAKTDDVLLSLHLKATMMKVSDPILFGHAVTVYYKDVFEKHAETFLQLGINSNNGIGDVYAKIVDLPKEQQAEIEADIQAVYESRPALAMVDSDKGITNLHVPSNVIVDASMPAAIRSSGMMWSADGTLKDTKAMIPDRNYAGIFQATIDFCKENGAFDVSTMGNVSNIGLMAQKSEEYGSHDKTFQMKEDGTVRVVNSADEVLMEHAVEKGDVWRMCQTKDTPIKDWVKLAVNRTRSTGMTSVFWLDPKRAHDRNLMNKVTTYLSGHDTKGLDIRMMSPFEATQHALECVKSGEDIISITGNVLRDYLTDLFPILELGTSAKMLSIVPLLAGGGLFETGAGGSAPLLLQQFTKENHLRWDSLGEYLALAVSLEYLAEKTDNKKVAVLAEALNKANGQYLSNNKSPLEDVNERDNRGSSFYLALYWAQAMAEQNDDDALKAHFAPLAKQLTDNEGLIIEELLSAQDQAMDMAGYYHADTTLLSQAMRPSKLFNQALDSL